MPEIKVNLDAELYVALHAEVLLTELDDFTAAALREALAKRINVATVAATSPRRGRPAKKERVTTRGVALPPRVWDWLETQKQSGESRNHAIVRLLTEIMDGHRPLLPRR